MATLTTHLLNSVLGTHAGGVGIALLRIGPSGARAVVFERATDAGGRLAEIVKEVVIRFSMPDPSASYHIPLMIAPNSHSVWWSS
jgi:5-hydroxyisourate hydrolase